MPDRRSAFHSPHARTEYEPGRSEQTAPIRGAADQAAWLDAVLCDLGRVHLVGYSFGGWLAMNQAVRTPERLASVSLIDPVRTFKITLPVPKLITDEQLRSVRLPVLALLAGRSVMHDAPRAFARAKALLPDARVELWPAATHAIAGESPPRSTPGFWSSSDDRAPAVGRRAAARRRSFVLMSVVWGIALLAEAALRVPLVYLLSADVMAALSVVLLLVVVGLLSAWTAWYAGRVRDRHASRPTIDTCS